jgi:uncharacterized membrane protein HdeD (DUF308 family)
MIAWWWLILYGIVSFLFGFTTAAICAAAGRDKR